MKLAAVLGAALGSVLLVGSAFPQEAPLRGPRKVDPRWHALVGARLMAEPGVVIENATILTRDGVIVSVKSGGAVPEGARVWDYTGLVIHPGFVEPYVGVDANSAEGLGEHWQTNMVRPERTVLDGDRLGADAAKELRSLGFTACAIVPSSGIFRGRGAVVALGSPGDDAEAGTPEVIAEDVVQGFSFSTAGWGSDGILRYPTSEMGAIALARQTFHDAQHHAKCQAIYEADPAGHEPPQPARALEALNASDAPFLFIARNEQQILRASKLAAEFSVPLLAVGTGTEFRRLDAVAAAGVPLIVPLAFPKAPDVSTAAKAEAHSLSALSAWEQAPTNLRRLDAAGATVALTTARLESRKDFTKNLAKAIEHGFSEEAAFAALTTTPAKLLGIDDRVGAVRPGMLAHLVVREGEPFAKDTKVRDVWVAGKRHRINKATPASIDGAYATEFDGLGGLGAVSGSLEISDRKSLKLRIGEKAIDASKVQFSVHHVHFRIAGADIESEGVYMGAGLIEGENIYGTLTGPDGSRVSFTAVRSGDVPKEEKDEEKEKDDKNASKEGADADDAEADEDADDADADDDADEEPAAAKPGAPEKLTVPFGAFGRSEPSQSETVLFKGATVWTAAEAGIVEGAVVLIENGKVRYVGPAELCPTVEGVREFDATGMHITPGLVDCHSHTGISGGVNEVGRRVTAEVRIEDVIDPDDINFYRQLAGGLTAANQLHGSANAIGGQNSVVKLRWGAARAEDMLIESAMPGIKFALGENPKRVAAGTDIPDEYPQTRMGVEALIHDRLIAGKEYRERWDRYRALSEWERARTMPPRRDLELQALGQIVAGERWIHSHSYRQDEILMLGRLAQEFGFKIGTFQHVLEGYKVADAIAETAVGASTFSDWWAYKFEVVDAIPHNAALMAEVGVNVSINSDSDEHARRLNTEAAKAVKYGGMDRHEAIKLVTLNPAIQLGVGDRIGSLEAGKDADLAVWTGDPMSYASRCVSTWVDGHELFSEEADLAMAAAAEADRQRIIQKLLDSAPKGGSKGGSKRGRGPGTAGDRQDSSRDLAALRDEMEALWRSGSDPMLARPGVCGCFDVLFQEAAAKAGK